MGLISSLFSKRLDSVFIDFESVQPTAEEQATYDSVAGLLQNANRLLKEIQDYKGAQDLVRKAMGSATRENEEAAFSELLLCVKSIKLFFDFSHELEEKVPVLLRSLSAATDDKNHSLQAKPAIGKQLAFLLNFVLQFDQVRMIRPHLSNDFAYYRRLLPKFSKHPQIEVKEDDANAMTLFTAEPMPMMTAFSRSAQSATQANERCPLPLAVMANSCMNMLKERKYDNANTNLVCARAMTAALVIYDRITPLGAFYRNSPIDARLVITIIQQNFPDQQSLLNAIRFSSKHFNDDSTPSSVLNLFQ